MSWASLTLGARRVTRARARRATVALFMVGLSSWVRAEGAPEAVRVVYRAPSACPSQASFEAELAERLGAVTFAKLGELARTLTIVIDDENGVYRARVELMDRNGNATSREVTAPLCDQAMHAIALVAALAVRSQAERNAEAPHDAGADGAPLAEQGNLDGGGAANEQPPRSAPSGEPSAEPRPAVHDAELEREVSAGLTVATGVGPGVAAGIVVLARLGLAGKVGRSIMLRAQANDTFRRELTAADVRLRVIKGRLELCPFEPLIASSLRLSPCPGFEAGSQSGESYEDGERVAESSSEARLWLAATLATRLRLRAGSFGASLGPELAIPITKNRFFLSQPTRLVYEVPDIAVGAEATIGYVW